MKVGNLDIEVRTQGNGLQLRIQGRPYGLETVATTADLLSLSQYLVREVEKFLTMKTQEDIP
ncbi:MAG: hypothetical protein IH977_04330 [Nitrospinae bacterium]|nr:hypothetical protein [Nitrospinota bacterium]